MAIPLKVLRKVRCRILDASSGKPVAGVVATLVAQMDTAGTSRFPLGTLRSDHVGYLSFDLAPLTRVGVTSAHRLLLTGPRLPGGEVDLLQLLFRRSDAGASGNDEESTVNHLQILSHETGTTGSAEPSIDLCLVFPVYVTAQGKPPTLAGGCQCDEGSLTSVQSPDVHDYQASPNSFVTSAGASLGEGACESLVPATLPLQEHSFYKVVVRKDEEKNVEGVEEAVTQVREVAVTEDVQTQTPRIKFAEVHQFRQRWYSLGHSLGEIKYSLALAPGEATQVAIVDWSREDSVSRTDEVKTSEYMDHLSRRDRSIEETIESALKESQGGSSFMAGTSGQATIPLTYVTLSFNHAIGYGVSNSWGNRNLEAESLQDLHDRIRQQTGYTRSLNSTVVIQASQSEKNVLQTRKVANHNHCHALTIQYYEVLRHYRIRTEFSGRRKALLVPFQPFVFSRELALKFRSLLEVALMDDALRGGFDAILRLKAPPEVYEQSVDEGGDAGGQGSGTTTVTTQKTESVTVHTYYAGGVGSGVRVKSGDIVSVKATGSAFTGGTELFGPDGHTHAATADFTAPGLRKFSLICKVGQAGSWQQCGSYAEIRADADGELVFNMNDLRDDYSNNRPLSRAPENDHWDVQLTYPSTTEVPDDETPGPDVSPGQPAAPVSRIADELLAVRLMEHLNGNQYYYNGCVWVLQNPIERRLRLEAALSSRKDLLDGLDDIPLAISGNYVAFAYDGPRSGWQSTRDTDPSLPVEDIVTLPTRGVFAEAMLGHCNACEERDPTRMWDWKEMTIEEPPAIAPVTQGPKGQMPDVTPAALPANVIQITQPPSAPDPAGLVAALDVLKTPNIFRDMSGLDDVASLLKTLSEQSSEANIKALGILAQERLKSVQDQNTAGKGPGGATGSPAGEGGGSGAGGRGPLPQKPTERFDNLQVAKAAADAYKAYGASPEEQRTVFSEVLGTSTPNAEVQLAQSVGSAGVADALKFRDLIVYKPPTSLVAAAAARGLKLQKIEDGYGDVNLDYYIGLINRLPNHPVTGASLTDTQFFDYVRINFPTILAAYPGMRSDALTAYEPADLTKWQSASPQGAVMEFHIDGRPAAETYPDFPASGIPLPEWGLVLCAELVSDASRGIWYWRFVTMEGNGFTGYHPVSGTREFALHRDDQGYFFTIRAADRVSGVVENLGSPLVFDGAERFWNAFYAKFIALINDNGGEAEMGPVYSHRHNWSMVKGLLFGQYT